jgi:4-diphosphocytidyl-2-C-methyl-D-erythritol kinase
MKFIHDVLAPAKLNLFLHITGRRADGYHLLQSVFMLIDWADVLHFELNTKPQIARIDLTQPLPEDDLITRAAKLLQQSAQVSMGATISVDKQIPAQAGMGGGSSDAASTLLALNRLWDIHWPLSKLLPLGLQLGADVPFFLRGRNAFVEGIGEQLTPIDLPSAQFLVVKPPQGLETGRIFSDPSLERGTKTVTISDFATQIFEFGHNDLQPVAAVLCEELAECLTRLKAMGLSPRMTGSGSAVFAVLDRALEAPQWPPLWQSKICSNLEAHPLHGWALCDD